jgi:hypothetical protein
MYSSEVEQALAAFGALDAALDRAETVLADAKVCKHCGYRDGYRTAAGPCSSWHHADSGGAYAVAPHSHVHVICPRRRPQPHGT